MHWDGSRYDAHPREQTAVDGPQEQLLSLSQLCSLASRPQNGTHVSACELHVQPWTMSSHGPLAHARSWQCMVHVLLDHVHEGSAAQLSRLV